MIVAVIILAYFVAMLTIVLILTGISEEFDKHEWLGIITFILCPPIWWIVKALQIAKRKKQHKVKEEEEDGEND